MWRDASGLISAAGGDRCCCDVGLAATTDYRLDRHHHHCITTITMESSSHTRLLFLLSFLLVTSRLCLADMEEQSLVKVSPLRDYPQVALIRWTVPSLTTTATFTFFSNVSSACQANIKMSVRKIKKVKIFRL